MTGGLIGIRMLMITVGAAVCLAGASAFGLGMMIAATIASTIFAGIAMPVATTLGAPVAITTAVIAGGMAIAPPPARADDVSAFYAGRTVQLVIGYATGGGYDDYARMLGRHVGRHIPGRPTVVVQNMPGAGSIKAANYLYNIAPKDGTVVGGFARGIFLDPLLGRADAMRYTAANFGWLGSISSDVGVCAFRSDAGIDSWADMQTKRYKIGGTGAGADSDVFANLLRRMFNLPMQLVLGYQSAAETVLAIQRKEVDGRCG
jgi:tripartite-type tricarboxylate transporter receptor subunit TctC